MPVERLGVASYDKWMVDTWQWKAKYNDYLSKKWGYITPLNGTTGDGYSLNLNYTSTTGSTLIIDNNYYIGYTTTPTNIYLTNNLIYQADSTAQWTTNKAWDWKPAVLSPEQIAQAKRFAIAAKARKTRAINKARQLLLMHLDIRQTIDFEKFKYFFVEGSQGNLYQIRTGRSMNVRLMNPITMEPLKKLCAHPIEVVPDFDTMLAQKLWIENDEPAFVKMANQSPIYINETAAGIADFVADARLALAV